MSQCPLPLSEAAQGLTGYEVLAIQKAMAKNLEALSGSELLIAATWAYMARDRKVEWAEVKSLTLKQLGAYFADEPEAPELDDEDDPKG